MNTLVLGYILNIYVIKLRKPQATIDLNLPTHVEEYPEFKVKARKEKDRVKEMLTQQGQMFWEL
jgi:hypothetical protein